MANLKGRAPAAGDVGVAVVLAAEAAGLEKSDSYLRRFVDLSASSGAATFLVLASDLPEKKLAEIEASLRKAAAGSAPAPRVVPVRIGAANDPFALKAQVAIKMLLNAHSTAIMAKLGKVVGNTMTNVSPSNLKLIGRATFLIQSHVNDALSRPGWVRA